MNALGIWDCGLAAMIRVLGLRVVYAFLAIGLLVGGVAFAEEVQPFSAKEVEVILPE